ncbi:ABC transporter ATP-binding protein [Spiroplasma tabanidicola]|uniref:ABC transporter ATP-binding protein n=1 Tax=Spiroplasma tabanidicola TaxID=324079 RepID=A0A6I6CCC6_9MOLU|nr:ABC transporter ATP-binding protein [Spiroplasma tabanidicola]QGS51772.1 ABC transporter ATP-binding protein [Spiroplasma tabanidicola]
MLEVKNLYKVFKNDVGVKDINLKFLPGEIIGILGPNGAGKSTLLKLIFKEYKKDSGEIIYQNEQGNLKGFSFFTDQSLFPKNVTLNFFCMYNAELAGIKPKEAKKRTEHLLKNLELDKYKNKTFRSLSAGMQKKAMLAVSLINDPEIIFFDEPTANLDIDSRKELISLIKDMKENNKSIIIASHILEELETLIDRVIVINKGKVVVNKKFDKEKENLELIYFESIKNEKRNKNFKDLMKWDK